MSMPLRLLPDSELAMISIHEHEHPRGLHHDLEITSKGDDPIFFSAPQGLPPPGKIRALFRADRDAHQSEGGLSNLGNFEASTNQHGDGMMIEIHEGPHAARYFMVKSRAGDRLLVKNLQAPTLPAPPPNEKKGSIFLNPIAIVGARKLGIIPDPADWASQPGWEPPPLPRTPESPLARGAKLFTEAVVVGAGFGAGQAIWDSFMIRRPPEDQTAAPKLAAIESDQLAPAIPAGKPAKKLETRPQGISRKDI